ncbi:histidine kinase dimerization/phosphoacceptor domain -containing protein [Gramella sp. AN32]|uniref:histidine kinase n=1 Tax=Christiangramia antarctica TaxID=2058158 RepID=A0ABW5XAR0_9FLAO|nr:histidine kinase dimerization/phosphoacceptor domain -containing protein [Gramella sp. AN32]
MGTSLYGQIFNLKRGKVYKQIFVETDDFGFNYLDQLESNLPKVNNRSEYFRILNDLAYYWHTRNLTRSLHFAETGLDSTRKARDTLWEGRFQITQAAVLLRMEKLNAAQHVLEEAKMKVSATDLPFLYTQLGYVYERRGMFEEASNIALKSLELGEKLNDKKAMAIAYSDLSNLSWKNSKYDKGLEYALTSLRLFEERNIEDLDYDFTLYVAGNNYMALENYYKALSMYKRSIKIGERYGFYNNLSDVYISLVDLYMALKKFPEAEIAANKAIEYADLLDNEFMLMRSWMALGKLQNIEGSFAEAAQSLEHSIKIATKDFGDDFFLSQTYKELAIAYAGMELHKDAYEAMTNYTNLKDSIFTKESDERIASVQTQFEFAQKENTINLQQTRLNQQRSRQNLLLIIACLLGVILLILYKSFRNNTQKRKLLSRQNDEKEFLLKEIHHRVKNNLEIVSSLLSLQSASIKDDEVLELMKESQNRVYSMSIIHQHLYKGRNLSNIEMKDYLENLGAHVIDSFGMEDRITLNYPMDILELDVDTAIPLGLIVNELLTNSLKHAFKAQEIGNISISLKKTISGILKLEVRDDGCGIEESVSNEGFGNQLMVLLTKQLEGKMTTHTGRGTSFAFEFPMNTAT